LLAISIIVVAADWGLLASYTIATSGYGGWNALLLNCCVLGISAGSLLSFAPRYLFLICHVVPLLLRLSSVTCSWGQQGYTMAMMTFDLRSVLAVAGQIPP